MAKVISVHEFELKPSARPEDVERLVAAGEHRARKLPGVTVTLLKGNRGARDGKYLMIVEIDSVAVRDRYWPTPTGFSDEARSWAASSLGGFGELFDRRTFTDYVALG
jgi:hypothetical protein